MSSTTRNLFEKRFRDFPKLLIKIKNSNKEILAIKHSLPVKPLDILLLTPTEVISNFSNHNPLFLDIAEDGIIINDKENFLSKEFRCQARTSTPPLLVMVIGH